MNYTERTTCRSCEKELPKKNILSLGEQTIVDFLADGEVGRGKAPLELVLCKYCQLLQLRHTVDADTLFKKFWYRSGINEQMKEALADIVTNARDRVELWEGDVVGDIGSNDATMLRMYPENLVRVGFEPSAIAQEVPSNEKVFIVNDYFSTKWAMSMSEGKKYKILSAIAMFYDLDEPSKFLKNIKEVLHPDGIFVVQMNYLPLMLRNLAVDNIGHEHLAYYSLTTLKPLFERNGLKITDVEVNGVNGGSFRVWARHNREEIIPTHRVEDFLREEEYSIDSEAIKIFVERTKEIGADLQTFLLRLKRDGKVVYAYGASTRGSTLLQTILGNVPAGEVLAGVAERDENKYGKRMAGLDLKIVPEKEAREKANFFLLLPYSFWESISKREKDWMVKGGKFIVPVPFPRVVSLKELNRTPVLVGESLLEGAIGR